MATFNGSIEDLKQRISPLALDGTWEQQPNGVGKFRCSNRAGMLWSETKGTIWYDGPASATAALQAKVEAILADPMAPVQVTVESTIFVVHGRDHESRDQLELVLRRLGLDPYVLQITGGGG